MSVVTSQMLRARSVRAAERARADEEAGHLLLAVARQVVATELAALANEAEREPG